MNQSISLTRRGLTRESSSYLGRSGVEGSDDLFDAGHTHADAGPEDGGVAVGGGHLRRRRGAAHFNAARTVLVWHHERRVGSAARRGLRPVARRGRHARGLERSKPEKGAKNVILLKLNFYFYVKNAKLRIKRRGVNIEGEN